jgi:tetratricopeptide (TPR) repeat protein
VVPRTGGAAVMRSRPPGRGARAPALAERAEVGRLMAEGVRHHRQGRLEKAARCYRRALELEPRHADGLHLSGLVAHQSGDQPRAATLIAKAIAADSQQAPYHNSLGVVLLSSGDPAEAERRLRQALALDPLYPEAHNNLGNALQAQGRLEEAVAAYDQAIEIQPGYAEAWCNRGRTLHLLDRPQAVESFRRALAERADWPKALRYLGDALGQQGERRRAEECYRRALALDPADGETHAALAALLERASRLQEGLAAAEEALRRNPRDLRAGVTAARAERRLGRVEDALARVEALDVTGADAEGRAYAAFERGQILDRLGDYPRAYRAFVEGNAMLAQAPSAQAIDREFFPQLIDRLGRTFTREWVATWSPMPPGDRPDPVFLIGFPRSGTTLLDQILDSHPALSTMEEKDALDQVRRLVEEMPEGYPDALAGLGADALRELRRRYFDEVDRQLGDLGGRTPVDKMPLNTIDAGLIYRLFPHARILLALRHPCDVVLSGFMQAMKPNTAMVLFDSLISTARFYAQVMGLWLRYREVLPLRVQSIRYEDLVADFAGETRRVLDFLGLPWDDAVLSYAEHAKTRSIATPSYHQVVQPIYRRAVGRWHNYADEFAEGLPVLQTFIQAFGYSAEPGDPG